MALLHSLEICGIRNFNPDNKQTVFFQTPVVLFQGPNGSGKTTILESIKYALTGDLPVGTNGGKGFIHDPKMSNKNSTKGSIKIKFTDAEKNTLTISRVLQVSQTAAGTLQFKKVNDSIRKRSKDDPDQVQDISCRCADIDAYCCTALNVSKSIFNNVLFCHQENSLWPLDEPKKLKEKFDDIFEATKYKKCVERLRKTIKEKETHLKTGIKDTLKAKKEIKDHVDFQRSKLEDKKEKLNEVKKLIEQSENELKPLEDRMKKILDLEESLGALQRKLTAKEEEKKGLINQQETLRKEISDIFVGTDKELDSKINTFKDEQSSEEIIIRKLERNVQDINKQLENESLSIQTKQVKIGQMKEEQNQYKKKLEEIRGLIDKLRIELDIEDFGDQEILLGELTNAIKSQENKFNQLQKENDVEENELQKQIDKLREENAKSEQLIDSKTTSTHECKNKLEQIKYKLEELDTSDSQLKNITDKIESLQSTLTKLKSSFSENEKLQEIQELKDLIDNKEQYREKLEREYTVLQRNYATEQKIESEKSLVLNKQSQIKKIQSKHSQNLTKLFGDDIPKNNLKNSVMNIQNNQDIEYNKHTKTVNKLEKELINLETTLDINKSMLKTHQQELSTNKRKLMELCKGKDFLETLNESYKKKEKLQTARGQYSAAKIMYEAFVGKLESEKCCPVCKTNFKNNLPALPDIIQDLKGKIHKIPSDLMQVELEFKKEEEYHNELQRMNNVNDEIETLTHTKIPKLEQEISSLTEQFEEKSMELAAEKHSLEKPHQLIEICKNLITDATLFDQYQIDISRANDSIKDMEESIEKVPSNRSRQENEMELDAVKAELSNTKRRYDTSKNMLEQHRDRCQDLNKKIQTEVQKQIDIQKLVQEKPLLEIQNKEYNEKLTRLRSEIEDLRLNLVSQKKELKDSIENKNNVNKKNIQLEEKARTKLNSNQNSLSDIFKLQKIIRDYERLKNSEKLAKGIEELAELKVIVSNLEKNKTEILDSISQKKESLAKRESFFRALKDNVTLREISRKEKLVETTIQEIKQKIGGFNYRQVFEEKQKKIEEINKKQREINTLNGQMEEIVHVTDELEEILRKPEYRTANINYKKTYYNYTLNVLALDDLKKYADILERSVLKFHEERMIQINRMIKSLWRTIYRGNDIDYIEIKTDESTTSGVGRRRTYQYKVVQVKNNIELDMRGRCSAGQKVLACLVIRLALAETFSSHCGILALDEPTTNLDKANISSLSDALSELINSRENQSNFQLLIITHDEEFLRSLTQVQNIDSYWQVKRNAGGSSVVERQIL
ncbi:DNA repair protein RAD50 [Diorhabda carinulata]|uniref:DNA repair protein RAD50 n=1 Tax=Diorhabda carinulata TaxID=1163345 RepID=UPI0025A1651F|nr:DNA repair protein RAD50 [Diorhabda carinulata]